MRVWRWGRVMDLNTILFEFLGWKWTFPILLTVIAGAFGGAKGLYWIYDRWSTRDKRRLDMLHAYLDKEEKDITSKRRHVLNGITLIDPSYLRDKKLDVGSEIDAAVSLLDSGRPHRAEARLNELREKIRSNSKILARRIADLEKHERSVNIFLAAVSDQTNKTDVGLNYISDALASDNYDADALRYKGYLLLKKGEFGPAKQAFDKLKTNSAQGTIGKAEGHLGLASVAMARSPISFDEAAQSLRNAFSNLNDASLEQETILTRATIHQQLGRLHSDEQWIGRSEVAGKENFRKALNELDKLPGDRAPIKNWKTEIGSALWSLEDRQASSGHDEVKGVTQH